MRSVLNKELLSKRMTRKEFLQHAGGALAVLFGLGNFAMLFNPSEKPESTAQAAASNKHGFGSRKFGV